VYCGGARFGGKEAFKAHVSEFHEQKVLSIFDAHLEGTYLKAEMERVLALNEPVIP
jgi:hypothetical protein